MSTDPQPRSGPTTVVIVGTALLNGGDAALVRAQLRTLEGALGPVHPVVFDQQADVAARLFPDLDVHPGITWPRHQGRGLRAQAAWILRMTRLLAAARALRSGRARSAARLAPDGMALDALRASRDASVVCTPGGTMLVDQYEFLPRLVDCLVALTLRRPLVLFTQTLGNFGRRRDRVLVRRIFRRASLVLVRGDASLRQAIRLGVPPGRVHVVADPVFLFAGSNRAGARSGVKPRIAVSVREWPYVTEAPGMTQGRYESAVADAVIHAVREHGAEVTFLSTCQGVPEYPFDDSTVAARIHAALPTDIAEHVQVDAAFHEPQELLERLASFDLVVATRLHAAILALAAGTAVVPISYEPKTSEVLGEIDGCAPILDFEQLTGAALAAAVDARLAEGTDERSARAAAVVAARASAESVATLVRTAVHDHAGT